MHAGYAKYRRELLRSRRHRSTSSSPAPRCRRRSDEDRRQGLPGSGTTAASSAASLHAKTFAVGPQRIFVGSFNLDPRSARLNTEMGIVIDSPRLATACPASSTAVVPNEAYEVRLTPDGAAWNGSSAARKARRRATRPSRAPAQMRRLWIDFLSILPIEELL